MSLLISASCFKLHASSVHAQEVSLSLSPPLVKLTIKPGKSVLIGYRLENSGDPVIITTFVVPFKPLGTEGAIALSNKYSGPLRFNLENAELSLNDPFFLKNKETRQLLLKISVPEDTPEGDYYYSLLNESKAPQDSEVGTGSRAKTTIGSNILITVSKSGQIDIKGKITKFAVNPRYQISLFGGKINLFETLDKIPIVLIVSNEGNNLITAEGTIDLVGNFGERAKYTLNAQNVLSQSQRIMQATPSAALVSEKPASLVLTGFFIGKYKLSTSVNFGEGTPILFAGTTFYAYPIKIVLVLLITSSILIFVIKKLRQE